MRFGDTNELIEMRERGTESRIAGERERESTKRFKGWEEEKKVEGGLGSKDIFLFFFLKVGFLWVFEGAK